MVKLTCHRCPGYLAVTTRAGLSCELELDSLSLVLVAFEAKGRVGDGLVSGELGQRLVSMRFAVEGERCSPALASICEIRTLPMVGQVALSCWTSWPTRSGNLLTRHWHEMAPDSRREPSQGTAGTMRSK